MVPTRKTFRHDLGAILSSVLLGWTFLFHVLFAPLGPPRPPVSMKRPLAARLTAEDPGRR